MNGLSLFSHEDGRLTVSVKTPGGKSYRATLTEDEAYSMSNILQSLTRSQGPALVKIKVPS